VLAVNKMDLVGYQQRVFDGIAAVFTAYARDLGIPDATAIPVSALVGDNVVERSAAMPWYDAPTLLEHLERVPVGEDPATRSLRFPVQYVIRPQNADYPDYRGYAGQITQGLVRVGDEVVVLPAGRRTTVTGIDTFDGPLQVAFHPQSVTLHLADHIDVSRGDLLAGAAGAPTPTQDLDATVCWLDERPLLPRQRVLVRHGTRTVRALVRDVADRLDIETLQRVERPGSLALNEIGRVLVRTAEPLPLDHYVHHRSNGSFLIVDEADGATLGAGMAGDPLGDAGATVVPHAASG